MAVGVRPEQSRGWHEGEGGGDGKDEGTCVQVSTFTEGGEEGSLKMESIHVANYFLKNWEEKMDFFCNISRLKKKIVQYFFL